MHINCVILHVEKKKIESASVQTSWKVYRSVILNKPLSIY